MDDSPLKRLLLPLAMIWRVVAAPSAGQPLPERWWTRPLGVLAVLIAFVIAYAVGSEEVPVDVGRDVGNALDDAVDWLTTNVSWFFQAIKDVMTWFLVSLEDMLLWFPWPAFIAGLGILCMLLVSWRMAFGSVAAMLILAVFGLWAATMETVALVVVTVTLSILIAVPLGIWASQNDRLDIILRPILDTMQTIPTFVYLVPMVALFSLGNVPGVLASLIFAVAPAVRLTNLGIRQLPAETLEAAESFGTTRRQMLLRVKIPLAIPTIMAGVNQTTLMALSMVVIAALVGAGGLGLKVYQGLGRIEPGNAFIAGLGIVFLAIIMDRITQAMTRQQQEAVSGEAGERVATSTSQIPPRLRNVGSITLVVFAWILAAFALADGDLSSTAFIGGAKALFVFMAAALTLLAGYRATRQRRTQD